MPVLGKETVKSVGLGKIVSLLLGLVLSLVLVFKVKFSTFSSMQEFLFNFERVTVCVWYMNLLLNSVVSLQSVAHSLVISAMA